MPPRSCHRGAAWNPAWSCELGAPNPPNPHEPMHSIHGASITSVRSMVRNKDGRGTKTGGHPSKERSFFEPLLQLSFRPAIWHCVGRVGGSWHRASLSLANPLGPSTFYLFFKDKGEQVVALSTVTVSHLAFVAPVSRVANWVADCHSAGGIRPLPIVIGIADCHWDCRLPIVVADQPAEGSSLITTAVLNCV